MFTSLQARGFLDVCDDTVTLTEPGAEFCTGFGIDLEGLGKSRAPLCRPCLDWSERETHLAGKLGRALLARMEQIGWLSRQSNSRVIRFTRTGTKEFEALFGG